MTPFTLEPERTSVSLFLGEDEPDTRDTGTMPRLVGGLGAPVAVVDTDRAVRTRLAMQLGDFAVPVDSIELLRERLTGVPLVVVLGPSCSSPDGLAAAEKLLGDRPEI
ncbi:MAG TPA: hypothetical protein VHI95_11980, partial [Acidimicrobiales bacterium]|nr:hypothetical protein [Acidimicrobiales bacterium]